MHLDMWEAMPAIWYVYGRTPCHHTANMRTQRAGPEHYADRSYCAARGAVAMQSTGGVLIGLVQSAPAVGARAPRGWMTWTTACPAARGG